ncbi:hypothetical protein acsn021_11570 [Anaerocolumna cellulosilytica]|uniref:Uncharacterized protein n=1 Tax=Anaerocolumna cellulosilytica TaxID=433286 RepID=A0A6S6R3G7_9FIRM|nr:hypothetical protein [Anaerocolumna cellulosilytica]MBB5194643.1 hypothetical protein [Anaerocolumna cellulosilytica]BCJ93588.1 hypothetical protein acsn021_11570 [Anaerocolumna cellulosilytica]
MTVRNKLYYLIEHYLLGDYDTETFCEEFTDSINLELDDTVNNFKLRLFKELSEITCRFSPYEEELKLGNVYFNENQVRSKVIEINAKLSEHK